MTSVIRKRGPDGHGLARRLRLRQHLNVGLTRGTLPILLSQPHGQRLGDLLLDRLRDPSWDVFRAAVAFAKRSGVKHLVDALQEFSRRGQVKLAIGVDLGGTSLEGLSGLFDCLETTGEIWVFHNENGSTFHPKVYVFKGKDRADVIIGSGNLTEGGLFTNYEASVAIPIDLNEPEQRAFLEQVETTLDSYSEPSAGTAVRLTRATFDTLIAQGYLPLEAYSRRDEEGAPEVRPEEDQDQEESLFELVPVPRAPRVPPRDGTAAAPQGAAAIAAAAQAAMPFVFYMTLMRTDAGVGQTTAGAQRRSPEIFIPLAARDFAAGFWDWPHGFTVDTDEAGKMDRFGVPMLIGTNIEAVTMTYFPHRHEFRLRSEPLRSAGAIGDVLRIERTDGARGYQYIATVIPQGTTQYAGAIAKCSNQVKNSGKAWGYE